MKKAILYVHGKGGSYLEAEQYKENCKGFNVIGVDYEIDYPWIVEGKVKDAYNNIAKKYDTVYVSITNITLLLTLHYSFVFFA